MHLSIRRCAGCAAEAHAEAHAEALGGCSAEGRQAGRLARLHRAPPLLGPLAGEQGEAATLAPSATSAVCPRGWRIPNLRLLRVGLDTASGRTCIQLTSFC